MAKQYMTRTAQENRNLEQKKKELDFSKHKLKREEHMAHLDRVAKYVTAVPNLVKGVGSVIGAVNDISWYTGLSQDTRASITKIPTFINRGLVDVSNHRPTHVQTFPRVYGLTFFPVYGNQVGTDLSQYDINTGYSNMRTNLEAGNSRIGNYEAGDLGQVQIASEQLLSGIEFAKRAIRVVQHTIENNVDWKRLVIDTMGFDYDDLAANYKSYRGELNLLIENFNKNIKLLAAPIVQRRVFMNSVLFCDSDFKTDGQVIIPIQFRFGIYNEAAAKVMFGQNTLSSGQTFYPGAGVLMSAFLANLSTYYGYLLYSTDLKTMYSDIEGADAQLVKCEPITPDDVTIWADISMLKEQMRNAGFPFSGSAVGMGQALTTFYTDIVRLGMLDINQDTNGLLYQGIGLKDAIAIHTNKTISSHTSSNSFANYPGISHTSGNNDYIRPVMWPNSSNEIPFVLACTTTADFVNIDKVEITEDDILEATRLHCLTAAQLCSWTASDSSTGNLSVIDVPVCGSELILGLEERYLTFSAITGYGYSGELFKTYGYGTGAAGSLLSYIDFASVDCMPRVLLNLTINATNYDGLYQAVNYGQARKFWLQVPVQNLIKMHSLAVRSELESVYQLKAERRPGK